MLGQRDQAGIPLTWIGWPDINFRNSPVVTLLPAGTGPMRWEDLGSIRKKIYNNKLYGDASRSPDGETKDFDLAGAGGRMDQAMAWGNLIHSGLVIAGGREIVSVP